MDIVTRLKQLAHAVADEDWSEFSMRVPADSERDADLVLLRASKEIESLRAELAEANDYINRLRGENEGLKDALVSIEEYWNRDQNEKAMADACWHAVETAAAALAAKEVE